MEPIRQMAFDADVSTMDPGVAQQGGEIVRFYFNEVAQKDYLRIEYPANKLSIWDQPVRDKDIQKYYRQYQLYKEGKSQLEGQTPLETWERIDQGSRDMYVAMNIRTVENLANIADTHMGNFPPGHASLAHRHRQMAREFVESKKHTLGYDKAMEAAEASQSVATAALEENKALKEQLEELRRKIEERPNGATKNPESWPKVHKKAGPKTQYQLSDGQIVVGKEAAKAAQDILNEG